MADDKSMETNVLEIIELFNELTIDGLTQGLHNLQRLLLTILPDIELQKRLVVKTGTVAKFIKLQDNFQYNIANKMILYHDIILDNINSLDITVITKFTKLLQGLLLIHCNSRRLFNTPREMTKVLKFIQLDNPHHDYDINISFISLLLHILLKDLKNFRMFEQCHGCSIIIKKLDLSEFQLPSKSPTSLDNHQQVLNFKIIEFLIFYLSDEDHIDSADKLTITQKSQFFRNDFPGIDNLIASLNDLKTI